MTFTATMKAKTTRRGLMGMSSVWERVLDFVLPVSSAWALVSSRMMRNRMRDATAAAPKLPARNVDVTVTTVVIIGDPLPFAQVYSSKSYLNPPVTRRFFENGTESLLTRLAGASPFAAAGVPPADER